MPDQVLIDHAITVRQPWAFAIAAGLKPIENRGAWCNYRGPVAIHAALQRADYLGWPTLEAAIAYQAAGANNNLWQAQCPPFPSKFSDPPDPRLALGGIIAVAEITGCHYARGPGDIPPVDNSTSCCPDWGQWWHRGIGPKAKKKHAVHIELANVRPLHRAIHVRGQLRVPWQLDEQAQAALAEVLAEQPEGESDRG